MSAQQTAAAAAVAAAANIQYHNSYLNYQHHYHQSQMQTNAHHHQQAQPQQQRSTFAIQELLGLTNDTSSNETNNFSRSYLAGGSHTHDPNSKALKISTNFENNHSISSINSNNFKEEPLNLFDKKTHETSISYAKTNVAKIFFKVFLKI